MLYDFTLKSFEGKMKNANVQYNVLQLWNPNQKQIRWNIKSKPTHYKHSEHIITTEKRKIIWLN